MDQTLIFWTIVGMAVVSYLPRFLPLALLSGRNLHPLLKAWLTLVPSAVLSAILVPSLLLQDGAFSFGVDNLFLWTAVICFSLGWKFKSLSLPVILGMMLVALARYLGLG